MAKEKEKKAQEQETAVVNLDDLRLDNMLGDTSAIDALAEIEKEKDEKKKREAKEAICIAVYYNRKTRAELRKRRAEDDVTKEELTESKTLLEQLLGVETEIKDGKLVPTKKSIPADQRITPTEYRKKKDELRESVRKKMNEIDKGHSKDLEELRNSYEGRYRYWWD